MRLINQPKIEMTSEQKTYLREAAEILKDIVDLLYDNKSNGFTPWQEGLIVTEAFWDLKKCFERIEEDDLIP